jgi:hypothetical protein
MDSKELVGASSSNPYKITGSGRLSMKYMMRDSEVE